MLKSENIVLTNVEEPQFGLPVERPVLADSIYECRLENVLEAMSVKKYDYLVFYADKEHFSNFEYLTGFDPRFEEGILILGKDGTGSVLLGNECYGMYRQSRIPVQGILYQVLSLPNQPIDQLKDLKEIFEGQGITAGKKVGVIGWKLMYPVYGTPHMYDIPHYIIQALEMSAGRENVFNSTDLMIHPLYGIRTVNTADDIAFFEFGASYASEAVGKIIANLKTGLTEIELARAMGTGGMEMSCHPMLSTGIRTGHGLVGPSTKRIHLGEAINCSCGLRGGLTCRAGYAAYSEMDLPKENRDYIQRLASPYFAVVANWFEHMQVGVKAADIFQMVQDTFPKEKYGWKLNPGHFTAAEEWSASPFYTGSDVIIKSGMCIQMDIIPSIEGYAGVNCEDGIAIADQNLRLELQSRYPTVYERIQRRRDFMKNKIGINIAEEILPLSNLTGLYRPFMLNKDQALTIKR